MKTITVYELLGLIKDDKELPKIIKYDNHIYEYKEGSYDWGYYNNGKINFLLTELFESVDNVLSILNYEVEILEEEKKIPEKLKLYAPYPECEDTRFEDVEDKINEIIDYLKSKGK